MVRRLFFFVAIVISMGGTGAAISDGNVIVAFGDSTTAPRGELVVYAMLVENALAAKGIPAKVVNAGVPGNTTSQARARLEKDVLAHNPNLVIIQFGINDAAVDVWRTPPAARPRVSLQQYENNLHHFVRMLKERDAGVVLMTPNPCRWTKELLKRYGKPPYRPDDPDGFNVLLCDYAEIVRRVAGQENVTLVDVYAAFQAYGKEPGQSVADLLLDGMHPNDRGQLLVANLLLSSKPIADRLRRK